LELFSFPRGYSRIGPEDIPYKDASLRTGSNIAHAVFHDLGQADFSQIESLPFCPRAGISPSSGELISTPTNPVLSFFGRESWRELGATSAILTSASPLSTIPKD